MSRTETLYLCGIDWQHEFGHAGDTKAYDSLTELRRQHRCIDSCGAVKVTVEVKSVEWVVAQNLRGAEGRK